MRKDITFLLGLLVLSGFACAVEINLSSDKKETEISSDIKQVTIKMGERITFYVKVTDSGASGGAFTLSREVEANTYKLVGNPHFVTTSCGCKGSSSGGDVNDYLAYTPTEPGEYRAEASYGGRGKRIDVIVEPAPQTAETSSTAPTEVITTTSTSTSRASSTTTTTATSTSQKPTTTHSVDKTTSTAYPEVAKVAPTTTATIATDARGFDNQKNYLLLLGVPLAILLAYLGLKIRSGRK